MNLLEKILYRIGTKPGYKIIVGIAILYTLVLFWNTIAVTAYVDSDGFIYATSTGKKELIYVDVPKKLTNSNYVNFDYFEYDSK